MTYSISMTHKIVKKAFAYFFPGRMDERRVRRFVHRIRHGKCDGRVELVP